MKNLPKILALFLVILLSLASTAKSEPVFENGSTRHSGEKKSTIHQANNPNLFAIHHAEKTGVNLLDRLPESNSAEHSQNYASGARTESSLQKQAAIYLRFCRAIDNGLSVRKIIFPFHYHL